MSGPDLQALDRLPFVERPDDDAIFEQAGARPREVVIETDDRTGEPLRVFVPASIVGEVRLIFAAFSLDDGPAEEPPHHPPSPFLQ